MGRIIWGRQKKMLTFYIWEIKYCMCMIFCIVPRKGRSLILLFCQKYNFYSSPASTVYQTRHCSWRVYLFSSAEGRASWNVISHSPTLMHEIVVFIVSFCLFNSLLAYAQYCLSQRNTSWSSSPLTVPLKTFAAVGQPWRRWLNCMGLDWPSRSLLAEIKRFSSFFQT